MEYNLDTKEMEFRQTDVTSAAYNTHVMDICRFHALELFLGQRNTIHFSRLNMTIAKRKTNPYIFLLANCNKMDNMMCFSIGGYLFIKILNFVASRHQVGVVSNRSMSNVIFVSCFALPCCSFVLQHTISFTFEAFYLQQPDSALLL